MPLDEALAAADELLALPTNANRALTSPVNHGLSPRELEILRLVASGRSNQEIAAALFISVPTVRSHLTAILGKLGLPSRSAAIAYAHTHGIV